MSSNAKQATSTVMRVKDCRFTSSPTHAALRVLQPGESPGFAKSGTVERVAEARLPTLCGEFRIVGYRSLNSDEEFVVLAQGDLDKDRATLVRIQCD